MQFSTLQVENLQKDFARKSVVKNLSLSVGRGEVLGFLGPNGSGKTTTMRMITGFMRPTSGTVRICGIDLAADLKEAQRHMGYLPENAPVYEEETVLSYLRLIAGIRQLTGRVRQSAIDFVIDRIGLESVAHRNIGALSKGFRRRVGLAQALLHDPSTLILDEPTDGLDPNQKHEVRALIREISFDKAIMVSTHSIDEVESICGRVAVISSGSLVFTGTPEEMKSPAAEGVFIRLGPTANPSEETVRELGTVEGVASAGIRKTDESGSVAGIDIAFEPGSGSRAFAGLLTFAGKWPVENIELYGRSLDSVFRELTSIPLKMRTRVEPPARKRADPKEGAWLGNFAILYGRELRAYFFTPLAYVFAVIFLTAASSLTFFLGGFFELGQASLDPFFQFHPWLFLFLVPAIAMRLWAEERKSGTIELLLTLPVTTLCSALAKFAAAWTVLGLCLILTMTLWLSVNYLGSPDNGVIALAYLGSFCMAGAYLSMGAFASALTKSQVIAFILGISFAFVFTASGLGLVLDFFSGWAPQILVDGIGSLSMLEHHRNLVRGVVGLGDLVFFFSTIAVFMFATVVAIENRKHE